ncbi:MAG: RraA family protein [Hyphomicrobiaceae bacterium]|nr:RraA family protein [Hyphomicrobiaceae bacterium]MCC0022834.1 RraA family protein [Hyphomicrobiaceae bacterium]
MSTYDPALFDTIRTSLTSSVLGDVMDAAGLRRQFLPPRLKPVGDIRVLVGAAMTVLERDISEDADIEPFGLMFNALDDLKAGEIYLCTGSRNPYALWGELMSSRAQALGAVGAVVDGFHRDTAGILARKFPVYSAGAYAQDQRSRGAVMDFRCPLTFDNGTRVECGDIIVADVDGVLAIPASVATEIVAAALEKSSAEKQVQGMIEAGQSTADIFERTGIM